VTRFERLGYAIVGCGWVAEAHVWGARALAGEDVELVGVADRDLARAGALARRFGIGTVEEDYLRLLDRDDVDVVSICLPDFLHAEATAAAAERGKHVLCEKPLALDVAGADAMIDACERGGVNLGVVFNHRYFPDNIRTRAAILDGAMGRPLVGDVMHSSSLTGDDDNSSPWRGRRGRAAGGVLSTQAIHFLDLLLWFLGPVAAVQSYAETLVRVEKDHEDTVALTLRMRSGALATLVTTNGSPITDDFTGTRVEVQGTEGYVALEGDHVRTWSARPGYAAPEIVLPPVAEGADGVVFGHGHVHEVIDFVRAVRRGAPAPVPGEDGRHLMAVIDAAYRSAREGGEVAVDDGRDAYVQAVVDEHSLLAATGGSKEPGNTSTPASAGARVERRTDK
jgi:UDP-N-acetyl-2-amino-2-deoxyglucuronate dehydrogenase